MYQKCPYCYGSGKDPSFLYKTCPVCNGRFIIDENTGKPPKEEQDIPQQTKSEQPE